ncbi:hypothetical protein BDY21DRAFT_123942 [Lineolata rhizophorae]|uniref:Uncharacterized protein n=1 Tax=Lineolata rhizophorae TaxID=578093 RepID=A0A6A6NPP2_9PEZI|nr:hypothetical protein BDY21DRAFT_123942 [Lineolata rhizophorae]
MRVRARMVVVIAEKATACPFIYALTGVAHAAVPLQPRVAERPSAWLAQPPWPISGLPHKVWSGVPVSAEFHLSACIFYGYTKIRTSRQYEWEIFEPWEVDFENVPLTD